MNIDFKSVELKLIELIKTTPLKIDEPAVLINGFAQLQFFPGISDKKELECHGSLPLLVIQGVNTGQFHFFNALPYLNKIESEDAKKITDLSEGKDIVQQLSPETTA